MPYAGICLPNGACIVIITNPFIQSIFKGLGREFLTLAQNVEFIGVAVGVSVLLYVELEIKSLDPDLKRNKKKGIQTVNDFFLLSLSSFLLSAFIDLLVSQGFPILHNSIVLNFLEAFVFVIGLFTLAVGIGVLRKVNRDGRVNLTLPTFASIVFIAFWALLNATVLLYSLGDWTTLAWTGKVFGILVALTTPPAVLLTVTAWGKHWDRTSAALILLMIPWGFAVTVAFATGTNIII